MKFAVYLFFCKYFISKQQLEPTLPCQQLTWVLSNQRVVFQKSVLSSIC